MTSGDSFELFPDPKQAEPSQKGSGRGKPRGPLAERMRPRSLDEVVGQEALLGADGPLGGLLAAGTLPSCVLWGPPGVGKTTLARLLAERVEANFSALSGVEAGVKEMREVIAIAARARQSGRRSLLFLDEIHRLNRTQQDALLPHVEAGTVTLVGATTENPSFEVIGPLLSRCRVFTLGRLEPSHLQRLLERALSDRERGLGDLKLEVEAGVLEGLADAADGDGRRALGLLEAAAELARKDGRLSEKWAEQAVGAKVWLYDRDREEHYNVISALIKSLRASDPDAALYYLARMLEAGEDPLFLARRLVIFASEDVGNADPAALGLATSTFLAVERIGLPEGRIPLGQAVTYLACAEKSNAAYAGLGRAAEAVKRFGSAPVPMHLRNAPTDFMKREGYGKGYVYPHNRGDAFVGMRNLPDVVGEAEFYEPTERGAEAEISKRLEDLRKRRKTAREEP
jgi:putative ATPase